jgi:ABC-type Zn uptake system ZnuABC Zn-binding protein ZnuA
MSEAVEAHEHLEHAEHARAPFDKKVAATMAIIAAALAVVSVLGHLAATEELLGQQRASDQWAFYQGKTIRRYESEIARDVLAALNNAKTAAYAANLERYTKETDEIQDKAKEFEKESRSSGRKALRLHLGEIFLEIAIVFASLAILTKRPLLWWTSVAGAAIGIGIAATTVFVA